MSDTLWLNAALILTLILANGVLAAAEMAIITVRKSRIAELVASGASGAATVAALQKDPNRFLATVQVGITVVGALAAALGGESAVRLVEPRLADLLPGLRKYAAPAALGLAVLVISYLSLVIGELVPKALALRHREQFSRRLAGPIQWLARACHPAVQLLSASSGAILRLFGVDMREQETFISEAELKYMVHEGARQGVFDETERQLIHSVFEFTDTSVREVMVPRGDIYSVDVHTPPDTVIKELLRTGFSRVPVHDGDLDHIVGVVHIKDLLKGTAAQPHADLKTIMHPAHFVPDSMQISDLLRELQLRRVHMTIVLNEFGTLVGVVTIEDLLEEIVGEIRDEFDTDEEQPVQELADGSLLAEGCVTLDDLQTRYQLPVEETPDYKTLAGLILAQLKRIPKGGEVIEHRGLRMTVVATDRRRVRKVRIEKARQQPSRGA